VLRRYCGKDFSIPDLEKIRTLIEFHSDKNRLFLSKAVCEVFNWRKPNGELKDMSCRVAMLRMERDKLIDLPPPQNRNGNGKPTERRTLEGAERDFISIGSLSCLKMEVVKERPQSFLWNELIDRYHYLGYKPLPGSQLRYFVYWEGEIVCLLGFGSAAWKVGPRDQWIGWDTHQREKNLQLIINNARFLILPWVRRKNLASKVLSLVRKRICDDWDERYSYRPVLMETFVENRFTGTSYKASGWDCVGMTQGRGKLDQFHKNALPSKSIWLFPLVKSFRSQLRR
jgi:hypothetical protein